MNERDYLTSLMPQITFFKIFVAGMCPGPAIVSFGATIMSAGLFVPYMLAGMVANETIFK